MCRILRLLAVLLMMAPLPGGAVAQDHVSPAQVMADAMAALRDGDWTAARDLGDAAGPVARDIIDWHWLRSGFGDFDTALDFLERRSDWPGLPYLKKRMEFVLPTTGRAEDVVYYFGDDLPQTGQGALALVNAHAALGHQGDAQATAVLAWINLTLTEAAEDSLLRDYGAQLTPLNIARLDMLLWRGATSGARRMIDRIDDDGWKALARARMALRADTGDFDALILAIPEALRDDPGLAWEQFRWRLAKGQKDSAVELLIGRSIAPELIGRPEPWAAKRHDLAHEKMREGDHAAAYAIAAPHHLAEGPVYAELEWLAGYLALRFLDAPAKALEHFRRHRQAVETPVSLGRAGYWMGRAHEALGQMDEAAAAYALGARHQTSFYGLLSAERLGLPLDPALVGGERFPDISTRHFRRSSVFEAATLLQAAGERDLATRFFLQVGESLSREDLGSLADFAFRLGEPHMALMIAKLAARRGLVIVDAYFPVIDLGIDPLPVPRELALAIARRESEFNPGVASGVGARGLMQLMPGTAREVAGQLDLPYSSDRLFTDPSYNATLGTAYLAGLIDRFGPSPILVAAGYNAGPGRPQQWIEAFGDPRSGAVDVIDWIEHIPFDETRNYVMRVAESLPVYRARITGRTPARLDFTQELRGG